MKDVVVAGGTGRTGREIVQYLSYQQGIRVVGVVSRKYAGLQMSSIINGLPYDIPVFPDLISTLSSVQPDVWVDFTETNVAREHFVSCVKRRIHPIIGTTGFTEEDRELFNNLCISYGCGGVLIPNFSLGAFLMLQAIRLGAKLFSDVAVIDMYLPHKTEIPSGTSKQIIAELKKLGVFHEGKVPFYSLRLAGVTAYQEVKFGGSGETLSISHNVSDRSCFGLGVTKAIQKVSYFNRLVTDLAEFI